MDMTNSSFLSNSLSKNSKEIDDWINVLECQADNNPNEIAFTFLSDGEVISQKISYLGLSQQSKALAVHLLKYANTGDRAMLLMPNSIDYIIALFACLYAGIIAVPAYPPLHKKRDWKRINSLLLDSNPTLLLCDSKSLEKTRAWQQENAQRCQLIEMGSEDILLAEQWKKPNITANSIAYLQYSSGSTGDPKGVMLSHKNLLHNVALSCQFYKITEQDKLVSWLPMYHDMGLIGSILNPIYAGFSAHLIPPAVILQRPFLWLKAISDFKATFSAGPNFIYEHCVNCISDEQLATLDLSTWRCAVNGAEPIKEKTLREFNQKFARCGLSTTTLTPSYGMAEASLFVAGNMTNNEFSSINVDKTLLAKGKAVNNESGAAIVSSGILNKEMTIKIVNTNVSQILPDGEIGSILIKGDSVSLGYWGKKDLSESVFNNYANGEGGYLDSGDIGFIVNKNLYICGRNKEVVIVNGRNHFPQDIEATIQSLHTDIVDHGGAVFSLNECGDQEQRVIAVQELSRSGMKAENHQQLITAIRQSVAATHDINLSAVILIAPMSLNKTTSGKIQRYLCREKYISNELKIIAEWEQVPAIINSANDDLFVSEQPPVLIAGDAQSIQRWITDWIAKKLTINELDLDETKELVSLGLDSVDAMTLVHDLTIQLGVKIDPEQIWQYPTINAISLYLSTLNNSSDVEEVILEGEI